MPQDWFFPEYEVPQKEVEGKAYIWDGIRRKWLVSTPEETVRQSLLIWLIQEKKISPKHIAVEREIPYFKIKKRFDVVVFDTSGQPLILCECKAPEISIDEKVMQQAGRYNRTLKAPYLLLTNGKILTIYKLEDNEEWVIV